MKSSTIVRITGASNHAVNQILHLSRADATACCRGVHKWCHSSQISVVCDGLLVCVSPQVNRKSKPSATRSGLSIPCQLESFWKPVLSGRSSKIWIIQIVPDSYGKAFTEIGFLAISLLHRSNGRKAEEFCMVD